MSDIQILKTKIEASGRKVSTFGQEFIRAKTEPDARKSLVKIMNELSVQTSLLAEQITQLDRNQRGLK